MSVLGENERIVGHGIDLAADDIPHIADGVAACAVDLRDAADRIGVLHLLRVVREGQTAPVQKPQQILCRAHLPLLAAQRVHLGIKGTQDAQLCLARHGGGDIRRFCQLHGVVYHAAGDGGHDLRAVDERKALLGRKLNGRNAWPAPWPVFRA